jgi:hypothetical protein
VRREYDSSEERDYYSQVSRYPLHRGVELACFREIEFLLEQVRDKPKESDESTKH